MPDRIIRSNILTSDAVNSLSWAGEVFYRRLMSVVDDFGRYDARPDILRGVLYSLKLDTVSKSDVVKWMNECSDAGLVRLYSTDGREYLELPKFGQRLRAMKSKYPPPLTSADICGHLPLEEKRRESDSDIETKAKGSPPAEKNGEDVIYPIEHCLTVALNDDRWVKANKATNQDLIKFNGLLERRGIYTKNPMDYKQHFANWKSGGKKDDTAASEPAGNSRKKITKTVMNEVYGAKQK